MLTHLKDENAVAIDYETFYSSKAEYSLSVMTPYAYVHDKRFDPYLVSICGWEIFDDGILAAESEMGPEDKLKAATRFHGDGSMWRRLDDGRQLYVGRPEAFGFWSNLNGRILLAHNAGFDEVVTDRCIELGIIPELKDVQWQDTADLTAYLMVSRSLKDAMKYLFDKEISKAVRSGMDGRHDWELDEKERRALVEYGGDDAVECHDIWLNFASKWPEIERKISCQNRDAIRRGFRIDRAYAEKALKALKSVQAEALAGIPWVTQVNPKTGTFYAAGSLPALRQAVEDLGLKPPKSFKKDDPGFLDWLKGESPILYDKAVENGLEITEEFWTKVTDPVTKLTTKNHYAKVRVDDIPFIHARTRYAGTVQHVARIETLVKSADENDLVRPGLIYFGAATGRLAAGLSDDSGGKNINMLNLPRSNLFKGDPRIFDGEGIDLRGMYIPREGYKYVIFDYSQIEARFALWLVDDTHMMEALAREGNLYQANAVAMGWCKPGANLKHDDPDLYRLAKCCVLGLGYGMGAAKFVDSCKSQGLDFPSIPKAEWPELDRRLMFIIRNTGKVRDPFDPKNEHYVGQLLRSDQIVRDWRRANAAIVQRWYDYADAFRTRAMSNCGTVNFRLPSGRIKTYWNPELVKELTTEIGEDGKEHPSYRVAMRATVVRGKPPKFLTGGNLVENITQATCRDIMAYSAVEIEEKHPSWRVLFTVYDEIVTEVPVGEVDEALAEIPKIMTHGDYIRDWTQGLPLEVEGGAYDKYCK